MAKEADAKEQKPEHPKTDIPQSKKTTKNNKTIIVIIGLVAFFFFVVPVILFFVVFGVIKSKFGDQAKTTKTISGLVESASGGQVSVDSNGKDITVKAKDGTEVSSSSKLPTDWPAIVVIYSPSTIAGSYKATQDGKPSWTVATTTTDTYDKVKADIASKYSSWTKTSEYESSGVLITNYDKDNYSVVITATQPTGSDTKVSINYSVTQK